MDGVLQSLDLGNLSDRFRAERVELKTVIAATDQELIRLGVATIGDRIRLRGACEKTVSETESTTSSQSNTVREERLALFAPRRNNSRNQARVTARHAKRSAKGNPWTPSFVCMADSVSSKTPTSMEKQILFKAGLGVKKIKLDMDDDEQAVFTKITCDEKDASGNTTGFPQLKICGGFEMMRCSPNCRDLTVIDCSWSAKDLRSSLGGGQGKIYLRPIQKSLSTKPLIEQSQSTVKEKCCMCNQEILVRKLRDHLWACSEALNSDDDHQENEATNTTANNTSTTTTSTYSMSDPHGLADTNVPPIAVVDLTQRVEYPDMNTTYSVGSNGNTVTNNRPNTSDTAFEVQFSRNEEKSVDEAVEETVRYCHTNEIHNPVEILRCFQQKFVSGRALDVSNPDEETEGSTNFIFVDRSNLLETAFEEVMSLPEYSKTLQVEFYGEEAQDYGGPRKEFFRLVLKEIKETYFDKGLRELMKEKYVTIGILLGLSIVQNGKIPQFIEDNLLEKIFSSAIQPQPCISELQEGLKKVGIYQVGCQLPIFLHLLRPGPSSTLTVRTLTNLLKADFSEQGSNKRKFQNEVYAEFMKYIREAASGRRNAVTLVHILQFATGAEEEPILGFTIHPSLVFVEATTTFLPTANTCTCCLRLPHATNELPLPPSQELHSLYDLAFLNAFFGHI